MSLLENSYTEIYSTTRFMHVQGTLQSSGVYAEFRGFKYIIYIYIQASGGNIICRISATFKLKKNNSIARRTFINTRGLYKPYYLEDMNPSMCFKICQVIFGCTVSKIHILYDI